MRDVGQRVITSRAKMTHFQVIHWGLRSRRQDCQPKRTSMNSLAKETGKSRQRLKDVNAALLSARKPACDPKPNAFDYLNYCKPDGASGTDLTAIHNSGCHRPTYQAQVTFRTAPHSSKKNIPTNTMSPMKENTHTMHISNPHVLLPCQQIHKCMYTYKHNRHSYSIFYLLNPD